MDMLGAPVSLPTILVLPPDLLFRGGGPLPGWMEGHLFFPGGNGHRGGECAELSASVNITRHIPPSKLK
jgi:hypothetical protein